MESRPTDIQHWLKRTYGLQIAALVAVLFLMVVTSSRMGYLSIGFGDVVKVLLANATGQERWLNGIEPLASVVVMDVRLPRILTAAIVGGGLAVSGAVFQGILLNPLADPYTLGVSAGAAFGASLALIMNLVFLGAYTVPLLAFVGAIITLFVVVSLSATQHHLSSNNLILSGVIVTAILSAAISFMKYIADEHVSVIIFWLMGSFASKTWLDVYLTFLVVACGSAVVIYFARDLNLVALGSRTAASMGVNPQRITLILLMTASLVAAICVAVSGIIGFVGLLVPHMVRLMTGPDNRRLVPISLLCGSLLLLVADTVTRAVLPSEIPIGVLTALIGGPFFCYIFRKRQKLLKNE